jgi:hypothetical protein
MARAAALMSGDKKRRQTCLVYRKVKPAIHAQVKRRWNWTA